MKALCYALLPLAFASAMAAQTLSSQRPPIIDMHMHAYVKVTRGPEGNATPRPCMLDSCQPNPGHTTDEGILRETLAAMEKFNIVKGFLSGDLGNVYKWVGTAPESNRRSSSPPNRSAISSTTTPRGSSGWISLPM